MPTRFLSKIFRQQLGLFFRFAASILALAAVGVYFAKKNLSKLTAYRVARLVLVFEGIYWLGLIATAGYGVEGFGLSFFRYRSLFTLLYSLLVGVIPTVVEAVILPLSLFILAFKLNPNKPIRSPIKWGLITVTIYIVVFWLINTSIWLSVVRGKGIEYLWVEVTQVNGVEHAIYHPEHLVSFITTAFGLLALAIYCGYFTKKAARTESLQDLKLGSMGVIILGLGMYFLWNYFSWVFFAGNTWNDWYAWFLGHNMDLWMMSLPLIGLPMLFYKLPKQTSEVQ